MKLEFPSSKAAAAFLGDDPKQKNNVVRFCVLFPVTMAA